MRHKCYALAMPFWGLYFVLEAILCAFAHHGILGLLYTAPFHNSPLLVVQLQCPVGPLCPIYSICQALCLQVSTYGIWGPIFCAASFFCFCYKSKLLQISIRFCIGINYFSCIIRRTWLRQVSDLPAFRLKTGFPFHTSIPGFVKAWSMKQLFECSDEAGLLERVWFKLAR